MADNLGAAFTIDIANLKAGLAQANRLIRESESQFRSAASGMDDWSSSQEGLEARAESLNAQIDIQKEKVSALGKEKQRIIAKMREEGKTNEQIERAVDGVNASIAKESKQLDKLKADLNKTNKSLDNFEETSEDTGKSVDDMGDATSDAGDKFSGLKNAAGIAVGAVAAVAAAAVAAVGAFFGLAESTREFRGDMAKLDSAFAGANLSAQSAEATYTKLFGVIGESDTAVEAAQQISLLANSEAEAARWAEQAAGVTATFGDALKPETFFEAANETLKLGEATGAFTQMLEGTGYSVEEFNAGLAACTTEAEKQAYMLAISEKQLGAAGDAYNDTAADIIAANEATAGLEGALAELGAIAEPIMTTLKTLATDLLTTITPFVALIGEGLAGAFSGSAGAASLLVNGLDGLLSSAVDMATSVIPTVVSIASQLIPAVIETILGKLPELLNVILNGIVMVIQMLASSLPSIIETIVALIPQLITQIMNALPLIIDAVLQLVMGIVGALPGIITNLIAALPGVIQSVIDALLTALPMILQAAIQLFMAIVQAIPVIIQALVAALPSIINTIIDGILTALPMLLQAAIQLFMAIIQALPTIISLLVKEIPTIVSTIISTLLSRLPDLIQGAVQLFMGIIAAIPQICIELFRQMPTIISSIVDGLLSGFGDIVSVGGDLVRGVWEGISGAADWLIGKISEWAGGVLDSIKGFFGIASPSKVMADIVGKNLALGVGVGFEKAIGGVADDMAAAAGKINPTVSATMTGEYNGGSYAAGRGGVVINQTNHYSQAHSRYELYKSKQDTVSAVKFALQGAR